MKRIVLIIITAFFSIVRLIPSYEGIKASVKISAISNTPNSLRPVKLHVATNGNDAWSGSIATPTPDKVDGPFATLERARNAVRELIASGLKQPVDIIIHKGTYDLSRTLEFGTQDGGTSEFPIKWCAADGERVVLRGAKRVEGWKRWKGKILQADLGSQGLSGISFYQLFYRKHDTPEDGFSKRMVLARFPNFNPLQPRTGGFHIVPETRENRNELAYSKSDLPPDLWKDMSQAEVVVLSGWHWGILPVLDADLKQNVLQVPQFWGGIGENYRYYIQNVLEVLDSPGEWYLDRARNILYFWPPDENTEMGDVLVPLLDNIVTVQGTIPYPYEVLNTQYQGNRVDAKLPEDAPSWDPVKFLNFIGLDFEIAEQDAIRISGAENCSVISCRGTNIGNIGINLGAVTTIVKWEGNPRRIPATGYAGGQGAGGHSIFFNDPCVRCQVIGCDLWGIGSEGIFVFGQDNIAENNHVHDIGLFCKDATCINLHGDRNQVRRNTIHDCPRSGIFAKGEDHIIEFNDIHHTALETYDMGAIYLVQRNARLRGNIIRYNRITDIHGYYPWSGHFVAPHFSWCVYIDDYTCNTLIEGNILVRGSISGIMIHGGGGNIIRGNIIIDPGVSGIQFAAMNRNSSGVANVYKGNLAERNIIIYNAEDVAAYRLNSFYDDTIFPVIRNNLIWPGKGRDVAVFIGPGSPSAIPSGSVHTMDAWMKMGKDQGSFTGDPLFIDPSSANYKLHPESPAWSLGYYFNEIPVEMIGCYESRERASWPLTHNLDSLPFHIHQRDEHAKLTGQRGKAESYYFPPQVNNYIEY